ncbi:glycerol-3-phosphate acyltransferase 3-like isoform X2 [Cylas formicarius]|uniref:glycerol-3-phosphate acyltransferase 3-like isoform X2 n=1 Tax=Cylas formicarius TaxID=197179 RepID=UPI0029586C73|nr:glycerol-3-phosphate acyltransferase 3-like isoform X2 [Cylas formicarius]
MAVLLPALELIGSILLTPFLMLLLSIIFLASIGKSLGVRRLYVNLLLMIFEYGRRDIESAERHKRKTDEDDDEDEGYSEEVVPKDKPPSETELQPKNVNVKPNGYANGHVPNGGNNLISRDDRLILVPEPAQVSNDETENEKYSDDEYKTGKEQIVNFELSTILDYIKSGVESIIEDQVTSRFEAEELKNWNLLIRTNQSYEFISWKLSFMWLCGFLVRYFFLFPLRVIICFFGILWLLLTTPLVGLIPDGPQKRWINQKVFVIAFRILTRSMSTVFRIHNKQWKPKGGSICVANHTTPIDVVVLSNDNCYCLVCWLTICTALVGYIPNRETKQLVNRGVSIMCFGILSRAISSVVTYHNEENKPKNGICVANHTSPIDVLILMCDNCYSLIGQRHGGFLGLLQRALARASPHIWFERSEVRDRHAVAERLREHVSNPNNPPILIFPEGTCINNTSVMQFKKGSFEVGSVIYPVAIKYDPRFGDAFWNSSKYSMLQYLYMMMTSWAIVCDVWYLPPMHQKENESAIDFANRVKSVIAKQGGLVDLVWDGQLKRQKAKKEWRERQQEEFSKRLKVE